ncbi:hypothetical protein SALBM135S_00001 [Streptomyces alboniger]
MVWEPAEEACEAKLTILRPFRRATGRLAPRLAAIWNDSAGEGTVPIGQHMADLRRKGGPLRARPRSGPPYAHNS